MLNLSAIFNVTETAITFLTISLISCFNERDVIGKDEIIISLRNSSTSHKREKWFVDMFKFSSPEEIFVCNQERPMRNRNRTFVARQVADTFQYISLRSTLTDLFSNETFFNMFFSKKASMVGYIRSHRDSFHFESHEFFIKYPQAVRLQFFSIMWS